MIKLMFYDIETVSQYKTLEDLKKDNDTIYQERLQKKAKDTPQDEREDLYQSTSGLDAQYLRVSCISFGVEKGDEFVMKTFYGQNEYEVIDQFFTVLNKMSAYPLCGYNNTYFDNAVLVQRALALGLALPPQLRMFEIDSSNMAISSVKPWEFKTVDLCNIVRAGKSAMSLNALCGMLNIPTPKDGVIRSDLHDFHYANEFEGIVGYCEKDVYALYTAYQHMLNTIDKDFGINVLPMVSRTIFNNNTTTDETTHE